ncbi:MAG TPA: hypothetical protein VJ808_08620, partial [Gemmatimonadales bacterium]|nr:hypothetical protein [Gemmatimonadales bacterium]
TAGNPGGVADGIRDSRSDFMFTWSRQRGEYRRPLDPGATRLLQGQVQGWKGFSPTFSMLGRVVFDQERFDPGTRANASAPFGSSPFVTVDTSGTGFRRTRAVLEGATGWKVGGWGLGVTLGFQARDHTTILSGVVRRVRLATPGVVLGAIRRLGSVEVGIQGRYRHQAEEIRVFQRSAATWVYQLSGYREVEPIAAQPPYYRRREENSSALGLSLAGKFGKTSWTLLAEGTRLREGLWRQQVNDPAQDRWNAKGWRAKAGLQRALGARGLVSLHANIISLTGDGDLSTDSAGVVFAADESAWDIEAELRLLPVDRGWTGTAVLGLAHESRERRDVGGNSPIGTTVRFVSPSVAVELGRNVGDRFFLASGAALSLYGPTSALPDPNNRGPLYQHYFAPELDLYSSRATPVAFSLMLQYRTGRSATLWLSGRTERLSSSESVPISAFTPGGSRTATSFFGGVILR